MNDTQVIDTLHALAAIPLGAGGLPRLLDEITEAAIEMAEADLGDLRLLDPASSRLRIAAQRGFPARWTEFWNASPDDGTSGQALRARKRMIVEDVFHSPSHADERTRGMLLQAGVRAVQSTPLVTRSGEVLGVVSTYMCRPHRPAPRTLRWLDLLARQASDLVENVSATAARHDAVRRFGALVAATPGVAWSTGPDWSRIDALKGPPCATAAQARDRDWLEHCVDPADRSRASVAIEAAIRARGPFGLQLRTRRADGSTGWSRSRAAPVLDAQDRIVEWIGTVVNATQSGQAGDPPFHERERLRSVLETLPVGVFLADSADCTRVSGNAALLAWLGASEGDNLSPQAPEPDAYGRRIAYAAAGEPLAAADLPMQRAAREGRSVGPVRLDVRLPDGRERVAQVCAAPIRDAGGDVGGAVAVYMDVTEFSAAAQVGEQVRHQDELLAEVSHELRNPLAAISSAVDMLADDLANARQTMEQLIRGQVGILGRLVDDLLDVSRTTLNGSAVLRKEDVSLRQLLENAAGAARAAIARRSQQLAVEPPPPDLRFRADGVRLQQVLVNLLDNA
ncbi:MAG: sensor histidine kinase [Burkholderiaceae bacterium]